MKPPRAGLHPRALWLVCLCLAWSARSVKAETPASFELDWSAPAACPSSGAVKAEVKRLAPSPAPRAQPLLVEGAVQRADDGAFTLDLLMRDGQFVGRRRFEGDTCSEVVGAAAVAIALVLSSEDPASVSLPGDQSGADGVSEEDDTHEDEATPATEGNPSSAAAGATKSTEAESEENRDSTRDPTRREQEGNDASESSERRWRFVLSAPTAHAGFGLLPKPSLGLGAGLGFELGRWRLLVSGHFDFNLDVSLSNAPDRRATISRRAARLQACRWLGSGRLQLAPCGLVALHHLSARGEGADVTAGKADVAWIAVGPGTLARLRVSDPVALAAGVGLEVQTARPVLVIEGLGELEQVQTLELMALVGLEWIF